MIKLVVVCDKNDVIGSKNSTFKIENECITKTINALYDTDYIAGGSSCIEDIKKAKKQGYLISRVDQCLANEDIKIVKDYQELVQEFSQDLERTLVIVGGYSMFSIFTVYADEIKLIKINDAIKGDLVYNFYKINHILDKVEEFDTFNIMTYKG